MGIALRLIWPLDMEWKFDEKWMFDNAMDMMSKGEWGLLGMESGGNMKNPALSTWIFTFFSYFIKTPIGMLGFIQWINIITILLWAYTFYKFRKKISPNWMWALTLFAVSPLPILFSRKIWAQDVVPIFTYLMFLGFLYRKKPWGALLWGVIGGLLGQIHMSGFFFSFGIFIVVLMSELKRKEKYSKWLFWLIGSALSLIPMIPWIQYILTRDSRGSSILGLANIFKFRFFTYNFMDVTGINLKYSLGKDFYEFLRLGLGLNFNSYLNGFTFSLLCIIAIIFSFELLKRLKQIPVIIQDTLKSSNSFNLFCLAIFLGYGLVLTFSGLKIRPHYLIILYPFSFYIFINVMSKYKKLIYLSVVLQFLLSLNFLIFIHQKGEIAKGDYGKTYRMQLKN